MFYSIDGDHSRFVFFLQKDLEIGVLCSPFGQSSGATHFFKKFSSAFVIKKVSSLTNYQLAYPCYQACAMSLTGDPDRLCSK